MSRAGRGARVPLRSDVSKGVSTEVLCSCVLTTAFHFLCSLNPQTTPLNPFQSDITTALLCRGELWGRSSSQPPRTRHNSALEAASVREPRWGTDPRGCFSESHKKTPSHSSLTGRQSRGTASQWNTEYPIPPPRIYCHLIPKLGYFEG